MSNPQGIESQLGSIRPDLPPAMLTVIGGICERMVSPDVPPPLRATALAVLRNANTPGASDAVFRDATDTLGHLKRTLGEPLSDTPASVPTESSGSDDNTRAQLLITLNAAERRGDADAIAVIQAALGITATE